MAEEKKIKAKAKTTKKATTVKKETTTKKVAEKAVDKKATTAKKVVAKKTSTTKKTEKAISQKSEVKVVKKKKLELSKGQKRKKKDIVFSITGKRYFVSVGKRKSSVARVRLYEKGTGKVEVNGMPINEYFFGIFGQNALYPLKVTEQQKMFDITVKVIGGGFSSQSDAVRHGISKALIESNIELRLPLKKVGLVTRDSRVKERKKPGLKGARRAPQWQKR